MWKDLIVIVEGTARDGNEEQMILTDDIKNVHSHIKQILNSIAQVGIVHSIEDPENPFNGLKVNHIEIFRKEDADLDDE